MPDFAIPPDPTPKSHQRTNIAAVCGEVNQLYYASTHIYHIGREDVGLAPDQQKNREVIAGVAMKLVDSAFEKRLRELKQMLDVYFQEGS